MQEPWITIVAVLLVVLGVLAELNLARVLIRNWREWRREERARTFRTAPAPQEAWVASFAWPLIRPAVAASCAVPVLLGSVALGQDSALTSTPTNPGAERMSMAPAEFSFPQQAPEGAAPQPKPAEEEKPLTISTNRPSFDDTTGIVPIHHVQLETGYTFTFRYREGVETQTHDGPEALLRIPLLDDRLELQVGWTGYVYSRTDSGSGFTSVDGFSDVVAGLRLKIVDENGWVPRICLQAATTVGLGSNDISNQDVEPVFKLIWSYDLGHNWGIYGNFGVGYLTSGGDRFTQGQGGVCLTYTINDKWSVYGEYYLFVPNTKGTDAAHYLDAGAAYLITPRIQLDGRVGFGPNEEANNLFTGFGISFLF
jgi:hypothetical protein